MRKNKNIIIGRRLAAMDMDFLRHEVAEDRAKRALWYECLVMAFAAMVLLLVLWCSARIEIAQEMQAEGLESSGAILTDVRVRLDAMEEGLRRAEQRRAAEASGPAFKSAAATEALFARPQ
jgi:hypothetical protein